MDQSAFEAELREAGYSETVRGSRPPHDANEPHAHDFDIRALVLEGEITLIVDGQSTSYGAGEVFEMAGGCEHAERVGPRGVSTLAGRRRA